MSVPTTAVPPVQRSPFVRFLEKVDIQPGGCWLWTAHILPNGYGQFYWRGSMGLAHRVAYELMVGAIPDGLTIDHLCRNTRCMNPDHMEPVSNEENARRGGLQKYACDRRHPTRPPRWGYRKDGRRYCRECGRIVAQVQRERRRPAAA